MKNIFVLAFPHYISFHMFEEVLYIVLVLVLKVKSARCSVRQKALAFALIVICENGNAI